jgi:hypothetical protein
MCLACRDIRGAARRGAAAVVRSTQKIDSEIEFLSGFSRFVFHTPILAVFVYKGNFS